jgi:hypothetical protein
MLPPNYQRRKTMRMNATILVAIALVIGSVSAGSARDSGNVQKKRAAPHSHFGRVNNIPVQTELPPNATTRLWPSLGLDYPYGHSLNW